MVDVPDKDKLVNHIIFGAPTGIWAYEDDGGKRTTPLYTHGPCHSALFERMSGKARPFKWLASASAYGPKSGNYLQYTGKGVNGLNTEGYQVRGGEEITARIPLYSYVQDYLQWLCSSDSPYRKVHKNDLELITDKEGNIRGVLLGPSVFDEDCCYPAVFNFLIANRIVRDYAGYLGRYGALKNHLGLTRLQSFLLMPYFSMKEDYTWVKTKNVWDGSHLPLSEGRYLNNQGNECPYGGHYDYGKGMSKILDVERLKSGDINSEVTRASVNTEVWVSPAKNDAKPISKTLGESTKVKTRFSAIDSFNEASIVEFANRLVQ